MTPRVLAYALLAACVAGAWSLEPRAPRPTETSMAPPAPATPAEPFVPAVPHRAQLRPALEPALRDPFSPEPPPLLVAKAEPAPPPPHPPPPPPPAPEAVAPPPGPPPAPQFGLSFVGRVNGPDGLLVVLATDGNETWPLASGMELPGGFRVEEIAADAVQVSHPASGTTARLELPPAPAFELR